MTNDTGLTRRRLLLATGGAAAAGLAGCVGASGSGAESTTTADEQPGHGSEPHGHDSVTGPHDSAEVVVNTARLEDSTEFHFNPHVVWVNVGGTVTWRLESGSHTATAYHPDNDQPQLVPDGTEAWDSGVLSEVGETFEHTFETEGVYHYLCDPHEQAGMLATVIVGEPHLDDQPAMTLPEDKPAEVIGKLEELNGMCREALSGGHEEEDAHAEDEHTEEDAHAEEDEHTEGDSHAEDEHTEQDTHMEEDAHSEEEEHTDGDSHTEETHTGDETTTTEGDHTDEETHTEDGH